MFQTKIHPLFAFWEVDQKMQRVKNNPSCQYNTKILRQESEAIQFSRGTSYLEDIPQILQ